jgi:uncharacterized protein (TIGR02391 family)
MSRKQASKRTGRRKAVTVLGAAGALSLAGSASAAIVGPAEDITEKDTVSRHVITLSEEEVFDVSLATFYVFEKEDARAQEDVWALYHRGKYDTAVFEAMKGVEVTVREASKLSSLLGHALMRKAFDVEDGPLTDKTAERSERQAMSDLFAGAIGAYKNPHFHHRVALNDPNEAAEIILLANLLIRIADTRGGW